MQRAILATRSGFTSSDLSSQLVVDSAPPSLICGLELLRAHAPQMAVAPSGVAEVADVRRDVRKGELSARIDVLLDALLLQAVHVPSDDGTARRT